MARRRPAHPAALSDLAPLLILSKILLLQIAYYGCAACVIIFITLILGREVKPDLLFNWRSLRADAAVGWMLALAWTLNSVIWYDSCLSPSDYELEKLTEIASFIYYLSLSALS